jgi:ribosome-associated protein
MTATGGRREPLEIVPGLVIPAADLSFETARSGGPGGQAVQTTDSRVRLRFALDACAALRPDVKARIRARRPSAITNDGELLLTSDVHRSQRDNLDTVRDRLAALVRDCLYPPEERRPTRPTRASKERRVKAKSLRGTVKRGRGKVRGDGE